MGLLKKEERLRLEGYNRAVQIVQTYGVEALLRDAKMKGEWSIPATMGYRQMQQLYDALNEEMMKKAGSLADAILGAVLYTLYNDFDFHSFQLKEFQEKFDYNTQFIADGDITWDDVTSVLKEEAGIEYEISDASVIFRKEKQEADT